MESAIFIIDVSNLLTQYLPQITHPCNFIESIPSNISIILPNWTCNDFNYTVFDFSRFSNVESIEIGDDSFYSVQTFRIDGLSKLQTLKIGKNSFSDRKGTFGASISMEKSFHVLNCESLTLIDIGENSFSDYGSEFELRNLPSLQFLKIGERANLAFSFNTCSFIVRGI